MPPHTRPFIAVLPLLGATARPIGAEVHEALVTAWGGLDRAMPV